MSSWPGEEDKDKETNGNSEWNAPEPTWSSADDWKDDSVTDMIDDVAADDPKGRFQQHEVEEKRAKEAIAQALKIKLGPATVCSIVGLSNMIQGGVVGGIIGGISAVIYKYKI